MKKSGLMTTAKNLGEHYARQDPIPVNRGMKIRQSFKIREIRQVLIAAGFVTLDEQAEVLGLSRSTTWAVLRGDHKCSGLSAGVLSRMLLSSRIPSSVRTTILEYVAEKSVGLYGHPKQRLRRFNAQLKRNGISYVAHQTAHVAPMFRVQDKTRQDRTRRAAIATSANGR
jgi:hypothetical protein